ncbi:MAG: 30S ribosomal protein THX [Cyclobacteriaceae bacterium]
MGRGDKKSKKGKRWRGSFGVTRNKSKIKLRLKRAASKKKSAAKDDSKPKARKAAKKKEE